MRVFLDTNVLVAAFATRGLCADVLRHVLAEHELLLSDQVLSELKRTLRDKIRLPPAEIENVVALLAHQTVVATPREPLTGLRLADADDVRILTAALAARADVFVTGDAEVLALGQAASLAIRSPREFWSLARSGG